YNTRGQVFYSAEIIADRGEFRHDINLSDYPGGIYICKLTDGLTSTSRKLMISH
ncbi:MAG: T9SS type A sorting domain-containing protein, partial [Bacteroidales bacterium]|nr:T9SS type A sorting domain-containing protein [Bacteroidales bacterium]